jgi:hypothetical protein
MKTYYVATLDGYVLGCKHFWARDETEARSLGHDALHDLYADLRERFGRAIPIEIQAVRPATDAEIDLWRFHHRMLRENAKPNWTVGDRVRLACMADDPDPIPVGTTGMVFGVYPQNDWIQVDVDSDNDLPDHAGRLASQAIAHRCSATG